MTGYVSMELNSCIHCILSAGQFEVHLVDQPYPAQPICGICHMNVIWGEGVGVV